MVNNTKFIGHQAEKTAKQFLEAHGLKHIISNYYCAYGEIDLIMLDKNQLVFVEVRARTPKGFGSALESVTPRKQQKILRTAEHYLMKNPKYNHVFCRFDVVAIENHDKKPYINWQENAFEMES
jgi:putative endonuclease